MARRTQCEQVELLGRYSACDVSDALLKLQRLEKGQTARAGYLVDIIPYAPSSPFAPIDQPKVIGPASTLKLVDKSDAIENVGDEQAHAFPVGTHWADLTDEGTILVIEQPRHQSCAAVGGIMATRMKVKGLLGCVINGRVRDIKELRKSGLPIWATGKSTVGSGAEANVHSRNVTIQVNNVAISPGDIVFADSTDGVVVIPIDLVDDVIDLIPKLINADDLVKADVEAGSTVSAAFKKHRE